MVYELTLNCVKQAVSTLYQDYRTLDGRTYGEVLKDFARVGLIDWEEVNELIIKGRRVRARFILESVSGGMGKWEFATGIFPEMQTFRSALNYLVKIGDVKKEVADLAIGKGNAGEYPYPFNKKFDFS